MTVEYLSSWTAQARRTTPCVIDRCGPYSVGRILRHGTIRLSEDHLHSDYFNHYVWTPAYGRKPVHRLVPRN